jgi:predicted nucleic acid-binding Zn ribbon protein
MARVQRTIRHWMKRMMDSPLAKCREIAARMHHA